MIKHKYIKLFSNCIPVSGVHKSAIYDLQRSQVIDIPNDLYDFIQLFDKNCVSEIFDLCGSQNKEIVEEYIDFLQKEELIFFIDPEEKRLFPELNMHWDCPSKISNAIIEISDVTHPHISKTMRFLEELGCGHLYIKILINDSLSVIHEIVEVLKDSSVFSVVFEIKYNPQENISDYVTLAEDNRRIETIFLISDTEHTIESKKVIIASPESFINRKECYFNINITLFTEAKKYNTYFNRKLCIDYRGFIKNAPETPETFGNIENISQEQLIEVINSKMFRKYWKVHKDIISECRDCEYRYMCVDNRLPQLSENGDYFFSTSCDIKNGVVV